MKDWKQYFRTWHLYVAIGLAIMGIIYIIVGMVKFVDKLMQL